MGEGGFQTAQKNSIRVLDQFRDTGLGQEGRLLSLVGTQTKESGTRPHRSERRRGQLFPVPQN